MQARLCTLGVVRSPERAAAPSHCAAHAGGPHGTRAEPQGVGTARGQCGVVALGVLGFPAEDIRARGCDGPSDFGFLAATGAS